MGAVGLLLLLPSMAKGATVYAITDVLIPEFEGFSAHPYWDVKRYSWGFGTPASGPTGTITREQALKELQQHVQADMIYLSPMITRGLTPNQWAALLSFSYNLGTGNADNLVQNINSGDDVALEQQWKQYIRADGVVNQSLVQRRAREWQYWVS